MRSAIFRLRDYRVWFAGDTASGIAQSMRGILVSLLAFRLTGSVVAAGALGTATRIVSLACMVPGGIIVDRFNRRRLIQAYATVGMCCWGVLAILLAGGRATLVELCVLTLAASTNGGLFGHATDAALRTVVPTAEYPSAMATNQGRDAAIELGGSPAAGALYALRDWMPGVIMAAGYGVLLACVRLIKADLTPQRAKSEPWRSEISAGFSWLWRDPGKRTILLMLLLVNFGITGLIYVVQINLISHGTRPALVGLLDTFAAIGSLAGSMIAGSIMARIRTGVLAVLGLGWVCLGLIPLAINPDLIVALPALVWMTLAIPAINAGLVGYFFGTTPNQLQGRVGSVMSIATSGLAALAPVLGGSALAHLGYTPTTAGCLIFIATAAAIGLISHPVRSIPRPAEWETSAHAEAQEPA